MENAKMEIPTERTVAMPRPGEVRSPLLDWLAALRKNAVIVLACVALGLAAGFAFAYAAVSSPRYESSSVVFVEPDYIELTLAASMGAPINRYDRALTDAMLFAGVAKSDPVLSAVFTETMARRGDLAQAIREAGSVAAFTREFRERALKFEYKTGDPEVTIRVRASSPELAQEVLSATIARASEHFQQARKKKVEEGLSETRRQLDLALGEVTKAEGALAALAGTEAYAKDPARKAALEQEIDRAKKRLGFLRTSEFVHNQALLAGRPSIQVLTPASLAASGETAPRRWGLWCGVGAALGLAVALSWIAYVLHVETMRELNPARYGLRK
jgi:hypothetical protein